MGDELTFERLNAIKARLGSIPPSRMIGLSGSIQKLLEDDLPLLIRRIEDIAKLELEYYRKANEFLDDIEIEYIKRQEII